MPELIYSHSNPLVRQIRSLRQKKGRQEMDLFLVEGIHPVGEVLEAGWDLQALVYAPDLLSSDFARRLVQDLSRRSVPCVPLTRDLFVDIAEKDNPQGILAIVHQKHLSFDDIKLEQFLFGAALIAPQDPGNVGTILRTLDAVAADGLFLLEGGVELYHPSVVRASMGALFWKPVVQSSFPEFDQWRRKNGCRLIGSSSHPAAGDSNDLIGSRPAILLLGNEQKGLTPEQIAACDGMVSLPMKGRGSSLNLAVAAGIMLYQMMENK
jgi:RNA methyltransferase, TrmH family